MLARITTILVAAALSGCVASTAVPIDSNIWRIETRGDGATGVDYAERGVLREAAALTLEQGYTHFLLAEDGVYPEPRNPIHFALFGRVKVMQFGEAVPAPPVVTGPATVLTTVTVVMLREDDARAGRAYRALDYI